MNFVCIVFEQGDEMFTLLSMEKANGRMQPEANLLQDDFRQSLVV